MRQVRLATPEQMAVLSKVNNDFLVDMGRLELQRMDVVNQTIRAESKSEDWWVSGWRPFWGFVSAIAFGIVALAIAVSFAILAYKNPAEAIKTLPTFITSLATLFAILGAIRFAGSVT